jgi:hypothetical protein
VAILATCDARALIVRDFDPYGDALRFDEREPAVEQRVRLTVESNSALTPNRLYVDSSSRWPSPLALRVMAQWSVGFGMHLESVYSASTLPPGAG